MGYRLEERTEMVENKYTVSVATCDSCGRETENRALREGHDSTPKGWKTIFRSRLLCPDCVEKVLAAVGLKP